MSIISIIAPPLIGSVIGYCTNYIAVKMLFRPLKPVKFFNKTLPFTPGIIPKGRDRLAKALGGAVGSSLVTADDIKAVLLSESMQHSIKNYTLDVLKSENSLKSIAIDSTSEEKYLELKSHISKLVTEKILVSAIKADVGSIIADKGSDVIKEKVANTMLAMFIKDSLINSLCASLGDKVNEYINDEGEQLIIPIVNNEIDSLADKSLYEILNDAKIDIDSISNAIVDVYINFIENNSDSLINNFNISGMVEDKVNEMDILDIENLLLSIMKKELNAVVNLGAVIGFILGLVNILF